MPRLNSDLPLARRRWSLPGILLVLAASLLIDTGCKDKPADAGNKPAAAQAGGDASQKLVIVDLDGLKKLVEQQKGKVVFIDFWATWCPPCVKGLPDLQKLQERYGPKGFQAMPVSFDDPTNATIVSRIGQTLQKAGWSEKPIVVRNEAAQKAIIAWLGKNWKADLPAQYVFSRKGEPVDEMIGGPPDKMQRLEKILEEQLNAPRTP